MNNAEHLIAEFKFRGSAGFKFQGSAEFWRSASLTWPKHCDFLHVTFDCQDYAVEHPVLPFFDSMNGTE